MPWLVPDRRDTRRDKTGTLNGIAGFVPGWAQSWSSACEIHNPAGSLVRPDARSGQCSRVANHKKRPDELPPSWVRRHHRNLGTIVSHTIWPCVSFFDDFDFAEYCVILQGYAGAQVRRAIHFHPKIPALLNSHRTDEGS